MSLGSTLIKSVVIVGLAGSIGYSLNANSKSKQQYKADSTALSQTKQSYQAELKKHPSKKEVTTNYQKAYDTAKQLLVYDSELYATKSSESKQGKVILNKIHGMISGVDNISGSFTPYYTSKWSGKIYYGGQDSNGHIAMAYKFYDNKNRLMMISNFYYNVDSGKLSGFTSFVTTDGKRIYQSQLKG